MNVWLRVTRLFLMDGLHYRAGDWTYADPLLAELIVRDGYAARLVPAELAA